MPSCLVPDNQSCGSGREVERSLLGNLIAASHLGTPCVEVSRYGTQSLVMFLQTMHLDLHVFSVLCQHIISDLEPDVFGKCQV